MQLDLKFQTAVRWSDPDPRHVPLLREGGITAVVTPPNEAFEKACGEAGISVGHAQDLRPVTLSEAGNAESGCMTVVKAGLWPGVQRPDPQVAGATRSLWLDQNCSLVHYLRAMYPSLPRVLAYQPDRDESLELALTEAWVSGGNYLMALDPQYREALLKSDAKAVAAWRSLGRTARWLRAQIKHFQQPPLPIVTVLVDGGDLPLEIAHLSFRHNVSPELVAATDPPAPDAAHRRVLTAVGIDAPQGEVRKRILAHAEAGTTLVVDGRWAQAGLKLVKSDVERDYYSLGRGRVVAYRESIDDPGMLALDLIDIVTQKLRPARIWGCNAGLVMASRSTLNVINYSRPAEQPVLARIQGRFKRATLLTPEADPGELTVAPRGTASEVAIPQLQRVATVVFG